MTKREALDLTHQQHRLMALGVSREDAEALRRISLTLRRWFERECGDSNDYGSWAIERDEDGDEKPFLVHHHYRHGAGKDTMTRTPIADRASIRASRGHSYRIAYYRRHDASDEIVTIADHYNYRDGVTRK